MQRKTDESVEQWLERLSGYYDVAFQQADGVHEQAKAVFDAAAMLSSYAAAEEAFAAPATQTAPVAARSYSSDNGAYSDAPSGYCGCPCDCWRNFEDGGEGCNCTCTIKDRQGNPKPCGCQQPAEGLTLHKEGRRWLWIGEDPLSAAGISNDDLPFE